MKGFTLVDHVANDEIARLVGQVKTHAIDGKVGDVP
jgi:hypothetical protein